MWTKSTIIPIHKKGSFQKPDNYRGISLTSIFSKIFTGVLNARLQAWAKTHGVISDDQAGFRKGYSTIDKIFILHSVIQKYLHKNKKVYVAFIDYKKAFDSIDREALWKVLEHFGIKGNMLATFKSIYSQVKCDVRGEGGNTDFLNCPSGLKQGCILSPMLFSYLIQVVRNEVHKTGGHGIQLFPDVTEILILLFADDLVIIADSPYKLQLNLNVLKDISQRLGLVVNFEKSKIVVFRNGGHLAKRENGS